MSVFPQIILPIAFAAVLIRAIGILIAIRLGRLTRGTIETPSEWGFVSSEGYSRSQSWLRTVGESAHTDWSQKARLALRLQQSGLYVFVAVWLIVILGIVFGR